MDDLGGFPNFPYFWFNTHIFKRIKKDFNTKPPSLAMSWPKATPAAQQTPPKLPSPRWELQHGGSCSPGPRMAVPESSRRFWDFFFGKTFFGGFLKIFGKTKKWMGSWFLEKEFWKLLLCSFPKKTRTPQHLQKMISLLLKKFIRKISLALPFLRIQRLDISGSIQQRPKVPNLQPNQGDFTGELAI